MSENKKTIKTDGQDLAEKAEEIKKSGVTDVIITVNTFNHTRYKKTNGGKELQPVIDGLNCAVGQKLNIRLDVAIEEDFNIVFLPTISYDFLKSKMPALKKLEGDFGEIEMYKYPVSVGRIGFLKGQE